MTKAEKAIIKTLAYFDVFNTSLSKKDLYAYLITSSLISPLEFESSLNKLSGRIEEKNKVYVLKKRSPVLNKRRLSSFKISPFFDKTKRVVNIISLVPSVLFIGISGSLAYGTVKNDDDIDLFIIARQNQLWITRFLVLVILQFLGKRRKKQERKAAGKFCLNMMITKGSLIFPKKRQDIYTAYEMMRMIPVFERNNVYSDFMSKNTWIKNYLFHAKPMKPFISKKQTVTDRLWEFLTPLHAIIDSISYKLQLWYMKADRTTEEVRRQFLALHPFDYRRLILREYQKRLRIYGIEGK